MGDNDNGKKNANLADPVRPELGTTSNPLFIQGIGSRGIPTDDKAFWAEIKQHSAALSFREYSNFLDWILCNKGSKPDTRSSAGNPCSSKYTAQWEAFKSNTGDQSQYGLRAYELLRTATELFLLSNSGVTAGSVSGLLGDKALNLLQQFGDPIASTPLDSTAICQEGSKARIECPILLELIWSYWHEEGMLVQTMNAVARRFQNRAGEGNPLANFELSPLRPVTNLIWGYIQSEHERLSVVRRSCEYSHEYGLELAGKAISTGAPAETRVRFLESFHRLLNIAMTYYKEKANTMVDPDGFPILNALKETHMVLAEGMHNQQFDLSWTARVEMLMQQWILSRPELREFLHSRIMTPYDELWMGQVDAMKSLQAWSDTSVRYFHDLAVFGEQVLLSIRFGNWSSQSPSGDNAKNWADDWRKEIQGYVHAYRTVTGVDLSVPLTGSGGVDATLPSVLLQKRRPVTLRNANGG